MSGNIGTAGSDDTTTWDVRILNFTGRTIFYRLQWGNSAWHGINIANSMAEVHSFPYGKHGEPPPTPRIQFDSLYSAKDGTPVVIVAGHAGPAYVRRGDANPCCARPTDHSRASRVLTTSSERGGVPPTG